MRRIEHSKAQSSYDAVIRSCQPKKHDGKREDLKTEMCSLGFSSHWRDLYDVLGYSAQEIITILNASADSMRVNWPSLSPTARRFCNWVAEKLV